MIDDRYKSENASFLKGKDGKKNQGHTAKLPIAATKQFGGVNAILLNLRYSICYAHLRIS